MVQKACRSPLLLHCGNTVGGGSGNSPLRCFGTTPTTGMPLLAVIAVRMTLSWRIDETLFRIIPPMRTSAS